MKPVKKLFPKRCFLCGNYTEANYSLCPVCEEKIIFIKEPVCIKCGMPLAGESELCMKCRTAEFSFRSNRSLFLYRDINRVLLHHYKFGRGRDLSGYLAEKILLAFPQPSEDYLTVSVPSSFKKKREKGRDQVYDIARLLLKRSGWPVALCLGKRNSVAQKTLNFNARQKNLENKFYLKRGKKVEGLRIILLDDVYTTGATVECCTKVLLDNGALSVDVITVFRD